jgi:peptide/nickel transport system substrate-binding protein
MRKKLAFLMATALIVAPSWAIGQEKGGVIDVATIGEPPTLDPMASTADLVGSSSTTAAR